MPVRVKASACHAGVGEIWEHEMPMFRHSNIVIIFIFACQGNYERQIFLGFTAAQQSRNQNLPRRHSVAKPQQKTSPLMTLIGADKR